MTVCRYYLMTAKDAQIEELRDALITLASQVQSVSGCEGVELFQEPKIPARFHFIERWTSVDAYRSAGQLLGKQAFAPIMNAVSEQPVICYLDPVALQR